MSAQRFRWGVATVLSVLPAVVPPALAQSLPEVVVSVSRSEQRSFDSPAAVQAVNAKDIREAGPQVNLSESLVRIPGITILDRSNYAQDLQVSIRGAGARSPFGIRGVRLLIDGIPATTPDGQGQGSSVSLTSMDRIEVLRGPMAQLYGNSSGGVIQAFTKVPSAEPEFTYQSYLGSYGLHRGDYQFSGPVGNLGLVADYSTFAVDGYRSNSATERKQFNGKLSFGANEDTHGSVVFNQFDMPLAQDPLGLTQAQLLSDPTQAGTGAISYGTRKTVLQNQLGSSVTHTLDRDHSLTGRAYYGTRDNLQYQAGTAATGTWVGLNRVYYGFGLQYNAWSSLGSMPLEWVAGYEFDRSREYRQGGTTLAGQRTTTKNRLEDNQAENSDFFVQGTLLASDHVSLVSGVRASTVRFVSDDYWINAGSPDGSGNVSYSAISPVLGVTFSLEDNLNVYANYGQGFETPTLAEMAYSGTSAPISATFNPRLAAASSQHYEIGTKWTPSAGTRLDFAMYQVNTADEIVVAVNSFGQSTYKNAPGTLRTGFELAASTQLTPHVAVSLSAGMIDAQYTQSFTSTVAGVTTTVASGKKLPGIPQTSAFGELAWTSEASDGRARTSPNGTRLSLELVQAGRIFANDTNTASVDGHTVLNVTASQKWAWHKGSFGIYGRYNNATDERYVGSVIVNQSSSQFYEPALPRNWSVGVNLTFPI